MRKPPAYPYPPVGHPPSHSYAQSPWGPGYAPGNQPPHAGSPPGGPVQSANPPGHLANPRFLKGALFGAAAAYVLSNETIQHNAIKAAVNVWSMAQGGLEELKERFRDAEAELHASRSAEED